MIKTTESKKPSKQFINYLKDTKNLPLSLAPTSKPKQMPVQIQSTVKKYNGPIEGDFSKISCAYVLENDRLIKKTPYGRQSTEQDHNQISEPQIQIEDVETIKQIAKLQYLEKKGYLKPQEMQRLQKLRGKPLKQNQPIVSKQSNKLKTNLSPENKLKVVSQNDFDSQNVNPNVYYQQNFISPKKQILSMKQLSHQNFGQFNNFQTYQYGNHEGFYQGNPNYASQGYASHHRGYY